MEKNNTTFLKDSPLLHELHPRKNNSIELKNTTIWSDKKAWWRCPIGHEWESRISSRTAGSGCPYCSNRKVNFENSLAYTHPEIAKEWHPTKNGTMTPFNVVAGSGKRAWWKCEIGHEWETMILVRKKGSRCPYCAGRKVSNENCLETLNPNLAEQWHPEKNILLTPKDVTVNSSKKVWWKCRNGHEWEASVRNRNSNGNGCPYCSNQKIEEFNSLASFRPDIAAEWHPTKNYDLLPSKVSKGTGRKVWWKCGRGHEWKASINSRTNTGSGCPHCTKRLKTSFAEQAIYFYLSKSFNVENRHMFKINNKKVEVDIFIPELSIAIEYDGYYHKDLKKNDEKKSQKIKSLDVNLIRIRVVGLPELLDDSFKIIQEIKDGFNNLNSSIKEIYEYILFIEKSLNITVPEIDVERDRVKIFELMDLMVQKDNIKVNYPHVAKEWHPSKNGTLEPIHFSKSSGSKVWWQCKEGHEWEAVIASRTNGSGCPFCSKNKVIPSNSLNQKFPEIAKEWHPTKNGSLRSQDVGPFSSKKVWWKCEKGHEWESGIASRTRAQSKCPYCSDRKLLPKMNYKISLESEYPLLSKEWHPTKNDVLPIHVKPKSRKKVWWLCNKGHEWDAKIEDRTNKKSGCPYCSGHRVLTEDSMGKANPFLLEQWDYSKNSDVDPFKIHPSSNKKVWWKCEKGHEWEQKVSIRNRGNRCPYCSNKKVCNDNCLATTHPEIAREWHPTNNENLTPNDVVAGSSKKVWWMCEKGHEYQNTVTKRTSLGRGCLACKKS